MYLIKQIHLRELQIKMATATEKAIVYRPTKYSGDIPGEKKATRNRDGSRTSKDTAATVASVEHQPKFEQYDLTEVIEESVLSMRRLYQTDSYVKWSSNEYDSQSKQNKIHGKLPKYMSSDGFKVLNSSRIDRVLKKSERLVPKMTLTFKGSFMGRTTFTVNLVEELRKLIVYALHISNSAVDVDKMIWLLQELEKVNQSVLTFLKAKKIDTHRYKVE